MTAAIAFIAAHWVDIVAVAAAAHGLALVIVNTTSTPKDNELYGKFYKVIEVIAGIVTKIAKKWFSSHCLLGAVTAPRRLFCKPRRSRTNLGL